MAESRPTLLSAALVGAAELELARARIARGQDPWHAAFACLTARLEDPQAHVPHALTIIDVDYHEDGAPKSREHLALVEQDGDNCYANALLFALAGDAFRLRAALGILTAWAEVNRVFRGRNAPLEAAWALGAMARAGQLIRLCAPAAWARVEPRFRRWALAIRDRGVTPDHLCRFANPMHEPRFTNNWTAAILDARVQLAILFEDGVELARQLARFRDFAGRYFLRGDGVVPGALQLDTERDPVHPQNGLGSCAHIAEVGWRLGVDLYTPPELRDAAGRDLFVQALELHARILNERPTAARPVEHAGHRWAPAPRYPRTFPVLPTWEIAYNHFAGRLGRALPQTARLLAATRPEGLTHGWGLGTITHCETASLNAAGSVADRGWSS